jgi:hypothetical protein
LEPWWAGQQQPLKQVLAAAAAVVKVSEDLAAAGSEALAVKASEVMEMAALVELEWARNQKLERTN